MRTGPMKGLHRVRWVPGEEPEKQCGGCYEYLPITTEFWDPVHGIRRCRACMVEANRPRVAAWMRRQRENPANLEAERAAKRAKYAATRDDRRTYHREYYRRRYSTLARAQAEGAA